MRVEEVPVSFELETVQDLRRRLSGWRRAPDLGQDWERGTPTTWIADLLDDWHQFDVDALQGRFDALTHYQAQVEDQHVHVVRVVGSGPRPLPLLLTHGPSSNTSSSSLCSQIPRHMRPTRLTRLR